MSYETDYDGCDAAYDYEGHTVLLFSGELIRVWYETDSYQDIIWTETAEKELRQGVDPVIDRWEDNIGNLVCEGNAIIYDTDAVMKDVAKSLLENGWTAEDIEEIMETYNLTRQYAKKLATYME